MNARAPLITAIVLLLLPVLYVVTYFANVLPWDDDILQHPYRCGDVWAATVYWPLEQFDRKVRPGSWDTWEDIGGPGSVATFETGCTLVVDEVVEEEPLDNPITAECFAGQ
jgi:hypothetical protein